MLVFIGGQHRSGSTYSFNIAKEILERSGSVSYASANSISKYRDMVSSSNHFILKSHFLDDAELDMVREKVAYLIVTKRDPIDSMASFMTTFGLSRECALENFLSWRRMYDSIATHALVIDYKLIESHPGRVAATIANLLTPKVSPIAIAHICKRHSKNAVMDISSKIKRTDSSVVDIGFSFYDQNNFYHQRHVTSIKPVCPEDRISLDDILWLKNELLMLGVVS